MTHAEINKKQMTKVKINQKDYFPNLKDAEIKRIKILSVHLTRKNELIFAINDGSKRVIKFSTLFGPIPPKYEHEVFLKYLTAQELELTYKSKRYESRPPEKVLRITTSKILEIGKKTKQYFIKSSETLIKNAIILSKQGMSRSDVIYKHSRVYKYIQNQYPDDYNRLFPTKMNVQRGTRKNKEPLLKEISKYKYLNDVPKWLIRSIQNHNELDYIKTTSHLIRKKKYPSDDQKKIPAPGEFKDMNDFKKRASKSRQYYFRSTQELSKQLRKAIGDYSNVNVKDLPGSEITRRAIANNTPPNFRKNERTLFNYLKDEAPHKRKFVTTFNFEEYLKELEANKKLRDYKPTIQSITKRISDCTSITEFRNSFPKDYNYTLKNKRGDLLDHLRITDNTVHIYVYYEILFEDGAIRQGITSNLPSRIKCYEKDPSYSKRMATKWIFQEKREGLLPLDALNIERERHQVLLETYPNDKFLNNSHYVPSIGGLSYFILEGLDNIYTNKYLSKFKTFSEIQKKGKLWAKILLDGKEDFIRDYFNAKRREPINFQSIQKRVESGGIKKLGDLWDNGSAEWLNRNDYMETLTTFYPHLKKSYPKNFYQKERILNISKNLLFYGLLNKIISKIHTAISRHEKKDPGFRALVKSQCKYNNRFYSREFAPLFDIIKDSQSVDELFQNKKSRELISKYNITISMLSRCIDQVNMLRNYFK